MQAATGLLAIVSSRPASSPGARRSGSPARSSSGPTFGLARKLPYKRLTVLTDVLLGVVLVVMVAAALVIGSYVAAEEIRVKRPRRAARFAQEAAGYPPRPWRTSSSTSTARCSIRAR